MTRNQKQSHTKVLFVTKRALFHWEKCKNFAVRHISWFQWFRLTR